MVHERPTKEMECANMRYRWILPLSLILLPICLSACGSASKPSLSFMYWSDIISSQTALNTGLARYKKAYPDLAVEASPIPSGQAYYEKLLVLYAAQSAPDVFFIDSSALIQYASRGALVDLSSRVARDTKNGQLARTKASLTGCSYGGKVYGVSRSGVCYAISSQSKQVDAAWTLVEDLVDAGFPGE